MARIEEKDILSFNFYTYGEPLTGSMDGMRYRIVKKEVGDEEKETLFEVVVWPEPFAEAHTEDSLKTFQTFAFSEEGRLKVVSWLNEMLEGRNWNEHA